MNVNVEELKQKFPVKDVPPYGNCIVVPGAEFNPDWEAELDDQGFLCAFTDLDQKAVTLVRLGKKLGSEPAGREVPRSPSPALPKRWSPEEDEVLVKLWNERVLIEKMTPSFPGRTEAAIRLRIQRLERYGRIKKRTGRPKAPLESQSDNVTKSPQEQAGLQRVLKGKDTPLGPRWTEDEYKLLIKLWNEHKKVGDIATKFSNRSGNAVACALARLKSSGAIKPRWTLKKNRFSKVGAEPEQQASVEKSVDTPVHTEKVDKVDKAPKDEVVELLKQILEAVKPQEELVCFESYCPSCRDKRSMYDEGNVWKACPVCGGPLVVWNVEAGKESS